MIFISKVKKFIDQNPLKIVGVHCTHGFNRTGFLIVSFLVEEYHYDVGAAILQFAKVRPPGIYKKDYIDELFIRYDEIKYALPAPDLPEWCKGIIYALTKLVRIYINYMLYFRI